MNKIKVRALQRILEEITASAGAPSFHRSGKKHQLFDRTISVRCTAVKAERPAGWQFHKDSWPRFGFTAKDADGVIVLNPGASPSSPSSPLRSPPIDAGLLAAGPGFHQVWVHQVSLGCWQACLHLTLLLIDWLLMDIDRPSAHRPFARSTQRRTPHQILTLHEPAATRKSLARETGCFPKCREACSKATLLRTPRHRTQTRSRSDGRGRSEIRALFASFVFWEFRDISRTHRWMLNESKYPQSVAFQAVQGI